MDKNKIIEAAAKLVAKGAFDKAIKEYRRILEVDPKDVRVLQKMGELFQKKNDNGQAAAYFTKVAESYSTDGFFLKAVALYKQVLKLDPTLLEINLRLAELHQQLQLISEATTYYQVVAQQYEKAGNTKGSLDTLKKIIELDPENVNSRIKLGEMYGRAQMKAEAGAEFKRAAEYLKRNGRMEEYQKVLDRLSALDGDNLAVAREVAQSYLAKGDPKRAIAKLQICFKADPSDEQTLSLLAEAFAALGQISKTVSVYKELAKIYAAQGRTGESNQIWAKIEKLDPNDADLTDNHGGLGNPVAAPSEAPARNAARASPPPPPASSPALSAEQLAKLLKETDVYVKYGLHDKALEHLGKIFADDPENLDAHEKAYQVYVGSGEDTQAAEQLLNVLRLCTRLAAVDRAKPYLNTILQQNPDHPEVATFVSVLGAGGDSSPQNEVEDVGDDAILVDDADEVLLVPEAPDLEVDLSSEDIALQAPINADELVDEEVFIPFQDEETGSTSPPGNGTVPTVIVDSSELGADASGEQYYDLEDDGAEPARRSDDQAPEYELQMEDSEEPGPSLEEPELAVGDEPSAAAGEYGSDSAAEECEEARFFLAQGLLDEAREVLETVLIAYPDHPAARELLALVEEGQASPSPGAPPRPGKTDPDGRKDAFDLAAELASELGQLEDGETAAVEPAAEDFQYSVDEVFAEFKKGLEKVVRPEDVDTHYDLGIAYREMGLTEDAIGEFTVAREGCVGKKKEIDCLTMIAMLQKAKGDLPAAIESYKRALTSEHAVGDTEKALEFELAVLWEGSGIAGKALYHYARVAKLDPQYRDVAKIVSRLSLTAKPEPDPLPAKKAFGGPASTGLGGAKTSYSKLQGS